MTNDLSKCRWHAIADHPTHPDIVHVNSNGSRWENIATVYGAGFGGTVDERTQKAIAIGQLLALAPEMLAALQDLTSEAGLSGIDRDDDRLMAAKELVARVKS